VEKYRPQSLDTYIGNETIKETFKRYLQSGDVPHLLLYGDAGSGKCLDYSEEIEIEMDLSDDEYEMLKCYEI
jgi:DNA polymerase III delta prime subunit